MRRMFIAIEGEIPILESDIEEVDHDAAGHETGPDVTYTAAEDREAAEYAAQRILGPTGLEVHEVYFLGEDSR